MDIDKLKELRRAGVKAVALNGHGKFVNVEFYPLSDDDRRDLALEALGESERAWVTSLNEEQREAWETARKEHLLYGSS